MVEVHDVHHVDTVGIEQLDLLVEGHEDLGCVLGTQHQRRVDVEGHDRREHIAGFGLVAQVAQHVLVTEMDAVEGPDRHDAALARVEPRITVVNDLHRAPVPAGQRHDGTSTTVGLTRSGPCDA